MPLNQPELKKYLEKSVFVQLNGERKVIGTLRGYDVFMNLVLDDAVDVTVEGVRENIGMAMLRGNAVVIVEALDRIDTRQ